VRLINFAAVLIALPLTSCGEPTELGQVSSNIADYKGLTDANGSKYLLVTLKSKNWDAGKRDFSISADDMMKSSKWVADHYPQIPYIRFSIIADMVDKYKNSIGSQEILSMSYMMADLKQINWNSMFSFNLLEFAVDVKHDRYGMDTLQKYCADADSFKWAPRFCGQYR
jgi:hypothetical protein